MTVEDWQAVGIVCGAILAALTLIGVVYRKGIRPMWNAGRRAYRRANEAVDQILGDKAKGILSLSERIKQLEQAQREHSEWHAGPGGQPARPVQPRPNGQQRDRR